MDCFGEVLHASYNAKYYSFVSLKDTGMGLKAGLYHGTNPFII